MLYSEKVMDHFRNPRNLGTIENADAVGEVGNAKCGDIMEMYLKIDVGIITDVKFNTFGYCNQLNGYRADKGQARNRGVKALKQGGCRGARRSAGAQDTLLCFGGGSSKGGAV